jgi:hypothetical protein
MNKQKDTKEAVIKPELYTVLSTGFRSNAEAKRFSKIYALLMCYQKGQIDCNVHLDASMIVTEKIKEWAYKELLKMKAPNGFQMISSFDDALKWFFRTCR